MSWLSGLTLPIFGIAPVKQLVWEFTISKHEQLTKPGESLYLRVIVQERGCFLQERIYLVLSALGTTTKALNKMLEGAIWERRSRTWHANSVTQTGLPGNVAAK